MAAKDLFVRVKFAGIDGLSRMLDGITGNSRKAGRAMSETNKALREQKSELRDVQRQIKAGTGNLTQLIDREKALETSIAGTNKQLERQKKIGAITARTGALSAAGREMVASGQMSLLSTAALAAPIWKMAKAGAELEALQNRLHGLGLGNRAVRELTDYANAMDVAGSASVDNLRFLLEAQGAFRESGLSGEHQLAGAKLMAPIMARMDVVLKATGKELGEEQERYFLRFIEQAGGLSSPKRAAELSNGLFRALESSGGNVQAGDYQSFLARAGIAGQHLSARSMFADFEPLIAELHEQAGVGLATGFKQATGIKVNSRAAAEFLRLGLWDRDKINFNSLGGVKSTKGNPLNSRAADLLQHDPVEFYRQIVMPAYAQSGIKTSEDRAFENARLFGQTGGNLFSQIDKSLSTLLASRDSYKKTQTLDQAYSQTTSGFFGEQGKLRAAAKDFMVAAGTKGGLLDNITSLMKDATGALKAFTAFGNAHPTAFAWLGTIVTDLLLIRAGLAITKIAFGGLLGPVAQLWGVFEKVKVAGSFAAAFPRIAMLAGMLRTAFLFLGQGIMRAGMLMLANPMVLAIVAIGAALGLLGYLVVHNWDKISAAFDWGLNKLKGFLPSFKTIGAMMLEGLLSMLDPARLAKHIWNLGKTAVAAFKSVLGIHSPSRVFAGLGGHMMTGLTLGIDKGADGPEQRTRTVAARIAAAMALGTAVPSVAAAIPDGGAGARPSAPAPAPMEFHYHAAPGAGDYRVEARKMWDEFKRLQAEEAQRQYRDAD